MLYIIGLIVSLFIALLCFISTNNIYMTIAIFFISILYISLFVLKKIKRHLQRIKVVEEGTTFINNFITNLSIKYSFNDAFDTCNDYFSIELKNLIESINDKEVLDIIIQLRPYFNLSCYKLFINIIQFHSENGGNILNVSSSLISEVLRIKESAFKIKKITILRVGEFLTLWVLSFSILIFLRFGFSEYYSMMYTSSTFLILIFLYFLLFIFSCHLFINICTSNFVKEDKIYE